jgi:hypothetical protein
MRKGEQQELSDDGPRETLADETLHPLRHRVQEKEARQSGEREKERPRMSAD